jgi:hypothetical protein
MDLEQTHKQICDMIAWVENVEAHFHKKCEVCES